MRSAPPTSPSELRAALGVLRGGMGPAGSPPEGEPIAAVVAADRPEAVLDSLLDLPAIIRVADHVATYRKAAVPSGPRVRSPLRTKAAKKAREIREDAAAAFAEPYQGRRAVPDAVAVHRLAAASGALASRDAQTVESLAKSLSAQARERFEHQLARVRQRARWLRADLGADVRRLGVSARELETLDTVLMRALESGTLQILDRLAVALDRAYVARFHEAFEALPEGAETVHDLAPMFAAGGPLDTHVRALASLLTGFAEVELASVYAFLDAASSAADRVRGAVASEEIRT